MSWHNGILPREHHHARHVQLLWPQQVLMPKEVPGQAVRNEQLPGHEVVHQQLRRRLRLSVHEVVAHIWLDEQEANRVKEGGNADHLLGVAGHPGDHDGAEGVADEVRGGVLPTRQHVTQTRHHLSGGGHILLDAHGDVRQGYQEDVFASRHLPQQFIDEVDVGQQVHAHAVAEHQRRLSALSPSPAPQPVPQRATPVGMEPEVFEVVTVHHGHCKRSHNVVSQWPMLGGNGIHGQSHGLYVRVVARREVNTGPLHTFLNELCHLLAPLGRHLVWGTMEEGPRHPLRQISAADLCHLGGQPALASAAVKKPAADLRVLQRHELGVVQGALHGDSLLLAEQHRRRHVLGTNFFERVPFSQELFHVGLVPLWVQRLLHVLHARLWRHLRSSPLWAFQQAPARLDVQRGLENSAQHIQRLTWQQPRRHCRLLQHGPLVAVVDVEEHF
mmetsp:Transcript_55632/g.133112  ORF Transcript_55632/g.133112 Transcript_55632/m.133112 type:complete len:444 (-) Transcript_55632:382-1713(-)